MNTYNKSIIIFIILIFLSLIGFAGIFYENINNKKVNDSNSKNFRFEKIELAPAAYMVRKLREHRPAIVRGGIGPMLDVDSVAAATGPGATNTQISQLAASCNNASQTTLSNCNNAQELNAQRSMLFNRGGIGTQAYRGPSDAHGAINGEFRVSVTNGTIRIDGREFGLYEKSLMNFWQDNNSGNVLQIGSNASIFDPVAHFDKVNGKWIIAALLLDETLSNRKSQLLIAVSAGNEPTHWKRYSIDTNYDHRWLDRIEMVGNSTTIAISGNFVAIKGESGFVRDSTTLGAVYFLNKAALYSGSLDYYFFKNDTFGVMLANDPLQQNKDFLGVASYPDGTVDDWNISSVFSFSNTGSSWISRELNRTRFGWKRVKPSYPINSTQGLFHLKIDSNILQCVRQNGSLYCVQNGRPEIDRTSSQYPVEGIWTQWTQLGTPFQWGTIAPTAAEIGRFFASSQSSGTEKWTLPTAVPAIAINAQGVIAISFRALNSCSQPRLEGSCGGVLASAWRYPSTPKGTLHYSDQIIAYPAIGESPIELPALSGQYPACIPSTGVDGIIDVIPDSDSFDRMGDYGLIADVGNGFFQAHQGGSMTLSAGSVKLPSVSSKCKIRNAFITKWYDLNINPYNYIGSHAYPSRGPSNLSLKASLISTGNLEIIVSNTSSEPASNVLVDIAASSLVKISSVISPEANCFIDLSGAKCSFTGIRANNAGKISLSLSNTDKNNSTVIIEAASANGDSEMVNNLTSIALPGNSSSPSGGGATQGSSSGGGCTVWSPGNNSRDSSLLLMLLAASVGSLLRRKSTSRKGQ